jgi:hypothetical protein
MTINAKRYTLTVLSMLALTACTTDSYDKGEGKYSLTQAEMVELSVDGKKQATAFVLDDDSRFTLTPPAHRLMDNRRQTPPIVPSFISIS